MPTTDVLTVVLSITAIVLSVAAIAFEVAFFMLQRSEARLLTKSVQDLVLQAVRSEKGIDQLSGQTMPLIERLIQARVSADRAQAAPEVEKVVSELLAPVQESMADLDRRVKATAQSDGLKQEMDEKLDTLRRQISEVAREAGERASRRPLGSLSGGPGQVVGPAARDLVKLVLELRSRGGRALRPDEMVGSRGLPGLTIAAFGQAEEWGLVENRPEGIVLAPRGHAMAESVRKSLDGGLGHSLDDVDLLTVEPGSRMLYVVADGAGYSTVTVPAAG